MSVDEVRCLHLAHPEGPERRLPPDLALGLGLFGLLVGLDDDLDLAAAGLAAAMCETNDWVRQAD